MKIYKSLLLVALFIGLTGIMNAQNQSRAEHRVQRLKEALKLTDDQTAKISEIMTRNEQKATQEQSSKPINKRAMMKNERVRMKAMDKEIEPLLSPEQLKKYDSYKKEQMNKMRSRSDGRKFKDE
jgi:Spy/CpxP family protein refolding chaperone